MRVSPFFNDRPEHHASANTAPAGARAKIGLPARRRKAIDAATPPPSQRTRRKNMNGPKSKIVSRASSAL
jgi:hypothetical protein